MTLAVTQTAIPDDFGKGGANIGDGSPRLGPVLQEIQSNLAGLDTSSVAATIVKRTVTITQAADLAGVAALTLTKNIGAVLPANARLVGYEVDAATLVSGGTINAATLSIGVTGTAAAIGAATSVFTGATGFPKTLTAGAKGYPMCNIGGAQLTATVTATAGNLSVATAGSLTVNVFYIVLP